MKKRILAAVIAAVFAILNVASALPVFALNESTTRYPTPEGYNDHDYQKLVAFLEQTDDEGVKNGEKLSENYDPNDPATWGTDYWGDQNFQWIESDGELRIQRIDVVWCGLCGTLDVSGCTALMTLWCSHNNLTSLDVSGCTVLWELRCDGNNLTELDVIGCIALTYLECANNNLTSLDVSDCIALWGLYCYNNNLTSLDVSGCTALESLSCSDNNLTTLDVSGCISLFELCCEYNRLTELDLSHNEGFRMEMIKSEGNGTIGYERYDGGEVGWIDRAYASPDEGYDFLGWYNEAGELVAGVGDCSYYDNCYMLRCADQNGIILVDDTALIARFAEKVNDYNEHDCQKIVAFLEQTDENGVKNGDKLSSNYDPSNPNTWGSSFVWAQVDGEYRIARISFDSYDRQKEFGNFDLDGCTALSYLYCNRNNLLTGLNVSGCTALKSLSCSSNNLTELDVSNNTALEGLYCYNNKLTELDVSGCTALKELECSRNNLTELDLSNNPVLAKLSCSSNNLTELDLSHNPYLKLDFIKSEGDGTIGYSYDNYWEYWYESSVYVYAAPNNDEEFLGWYNEAGELIVSADECNFNDYYNAYQSEFSGTTENVLIAKFTEAEPIPGDADGDGELTSDDVLLLMRAVMGLDDITDDMLANCDMNGDGVVNFTDALIMLRMVLDMLPNTVAY